MKIPGIDEGEGGEGGAIPEPEEIIDGIEKRIKARLSESENPTYRSLAERLDRLRQAQFETASDSVEFLKRLLELAREVVAADREEKESDGGRADGGGGDAETEGLVPEQRIGALTQIFTEFKPDAAPEIIDGVVKEIDSVVSGARFSRWQTSREGERAVKTAIRQALKKFGLPPSGQIFDKAYDYVAEHY